MRSPEDPPDNSPEPAALSTAQDLLADVLSSIDQLGTLFGGYVLYEKLGRGGFGIVFRAQRVGSDETVALKRMRGADHATAEERKDFLSGAETAAALDHPGIVRVRALGESDNCPFFTMDFVAGGNLAAALESGQPSQAEAARWLRDIALAVHHAHSSEVLHRDLKPANILLDERGRPLVADFGSARRLSEQGHCLESGEGVLSYYMAPEQASGDTRALTRRADIYSLGVILYELLCGQVPYEELPFAAWVSELVSLEPVRSPRELEPEVSRDLERICLKCLEKDPLRRYESAALLTADLELVLQGRRPRHARLERAPARALRWVRRHPLLSGLVGGALLLGLVLVLSVLSLLQSEREQERSALDTNAFIANSEAGALLFQLREFAERVERCAQKPIAQELLSRGLLLENAPDLAGCARGLQAVNVMATDGRLLAQWPPPKLPILGKSYAFRDYFRGARYLAEHGLPGAYLGFAYRAESSGQLEFSFAAPVRGSDGKWIGSVVASLGVDSTLGQVQMTDSVESGRIVALLGPRDVDRATSQAPPPRDFYFIVHPQLSRGREVPLQGLSRATLDRAFGPAASAGEQFSLRWAPPLLLSEYRDPLLDRTPSSLAAFAPVGRTGYIVVVETSKVVVARGGRALAHKLAWRAGVPLAAGLCLLAWSVLSTARRRRSLDARPRWFARRASSRA
jgi:eukaryotic-like serine/threonine-protein kinase